MLEDQPWNRPPEPIPASYYARPPARAEAPDRRRWRWIVLAAGAVVCLVWIVQTPWRPALGLFGLLLLGAIVLATDTFQIRARIPLLGSREPRLAIAGWSLVGLVLLLAAILSLAGPGGASSARRPTAAVAATPQPSPPSLALPLPPDTATPEQATTPTPSPTVRPTTTPTPARTPTPLAVVVFLKPSYTAQRNQSVTVSVLTTPRTSCTLTPNYQHDPGSMARTSDATGVASWTWTVSRLAPTGTTTLSVRCGTATASVPFTIQA